VPPEFHNFDRVGQSIFARRVFWIVLLFVVGVVVFSGYVDNQWLYDDHALIVGSPWYQQPFHLTDLVRDLGAVLVHAPMKYWRPGQLVLYRTEYEIFGFGLMGWHVVAILLHIAAACLFFLLVCRLLDDVALSGFAALLFLVHPLTSEVVGSNNFQISSAEAIFVFGCLMAALRGRWGVVFLCTAAALSFRESALALPVVVGVLALARARAQRAAWVSVASSAAACALYVFVRFGVLGHGLLTAPVQLPAVQRIGLIAFHAVRLFVLPLPGNLSLYHDLRAETFVVIVGWLALAAAVSLGVWLAAAARRDETRRPLAFFFLAGLICAAPYVGIVQPYILFAEHYFYLPCAFMIAGLAAMLGRVRKWRFIAVAALALAAVFAVVSYHREATFQDNFAAFRDVAQKYPDLHWAHLSLARHDLAADDPEHALVEAQQVLRLTGGANLEAWKLLGYAYAKTGKARRAESCFRQAGEEGEYELALLLYSERRHAELVALLDDVERANRRQKFLDRVPAELRAPLTQAMNE
jgi:hypothetical protein